MIWGNNACLVSRLDELGGFRRFTCTSAKFRFIIVRTLKYSNLVAATCDHYTLLIIYSEITKNGYTRSSNNHFRVQLKSSTRTPPGRPLIGRTTVVPGSGSEQSGCTRCAELMFRSTRYWLPLYPELVRSVQATRRRAHTRTRARVHTRRTLRIRISVARQIFRYFRTRDQPPGYRSPSEHTTNPQDTDLRRTSNITIFYNNNAVHFAARRILCENAPYVCMSYPASSTNISTLAQQPETTNEPAIT